MQKKLFLLSSLLLFSFFSAFAFDSPKHEVRAVWLTTLSRLDWPTTVIRGKHDVGRQKEELIKILDQYQKANINTVFFQTRVRATTVFPSDAMTGNEPWDRAFTDVEGKAPGYDPLAFAIEECHRRGMELHAWIVTIPVGKWNANGCRTLRKRFPKMVMKIGDEGYMNPADPQTSKYLASYCSGIARRYDIDGIHLDYIRYPETMKRLPEANSGRENISAIVKAIHDAVRREKGWVRISCSPIGKHDDTKRFSSRGWNARSRVLQDAKAWLERGWMDALFPMMYFKGDHFYPFLVDWSEGRFGTCVTPGLGIYFLHPRQKNWELEDITRQMYVSRSFGMGFCFFRSKFFTENTKGLYDFVSNLFCTSPALLPPMNNRTNAIPPKQPSVLNIYSYDGRTYLAWSGAADNSDGDYLMYNVYSSDRFPVDTANPRNLLVAHLHATTFSFEGNTSSYFAVTAVDRYGEESTPCQLSQDGSLPYYIIRNGVAKDFMEQLKKKQ